jgi:hypothetical protein
MKTPERCLRCDWWSHNKSKCDRVFKAQVRIGQDAGEIVIETQPGLIPKDMEEELSSYLAIVLGDIVDAWPGWAEIKRIRDGGKACAGESPSRTVKEFGTHLKLAKPLQEPQPLKNLDAHGLFKSDISLF